MSQSSLEEKSVDEIMLSQNEEEKPKKKVSKNKLKQTLQMFVSQVSTKSKQIKKPPKKEIIDKKEEKKPQKIKSPKKPSLNFCDVTYQPIINSIDGPITLTQKFAGNRQGLVCFSKNAFTSDQKCQICTHEAGLKTQTSSGQIHIICGLLCDSVTINYQSLKMDLEYGAETSNQKCDICSKSGYLVRCLHKSCKRFVHVFCVFEMYKNRKIAEVQNDSESQDSVDEEDEVLQGWLIQFFVQDYNKQKYSGNHQEILSSDLDFLNENLSLQTPDNTPEKFGEPKGQQENIPSRYNLPKRGGKVQIMCEQHRPVLDHCHCDIKSQQIHMIMCDFCERWQHTKCEQLKSTEAKSLKEYKCTNCRSWDQKQEVIESILNNESTECLYQNQSDFLKWETWKRSILPTKLQIPYTIQKIIKIAEAWTIQSKQLMEQNCNIEILKQQLLIAQYIPLRLETQGLLDRVKKALQYQENQPLTKLKLIYGEDNSKVVQQAHEQYQKQLQQIGVVTNEARELEISVIEQDLLIQESKLILKGKQIKLQQLQDITDDLEVEELKNELIEILKRGLKWDNKDLKKMQLEEIETYLSEKPIELDFEDKVQALKNDIQASYDWDKQIQVLEGSEKLICIQNLTQLKYKSIAQIELQKQIKMDFIKFLQTEDRKLKCKKNLEETIQKSPPLVQNELIKILKQVEKAEKQLDQLLNQETLDKEEMFKMNNLVQTQVVILQREKTFDDFCSIYKWIENGSFIDIEQLQHPNKFNSPKIDEANKLKSELDVLQHNLLVEAEFNKCLEIIEQMKAIGQKLNTQNVNVKINEYKQLFKYQDQKQLNKSQLQQLLTKIKKYNLKVVETISQNIFSNISKQSLDSEMSFPKLQELLSQTEDSETKTLIQSKIKQFESWQQKLSKIQFTDPQIIKQLQAQNCYIEKANDLITEAKQIKLKISENDQKYLQKLIKWCGIVQQCYKIQSINDEDQLLQVLRDLKSLRSMNDITICKAVTQDLQKFKQLQISISKIDGDDMIEQVESKLVELQSLNLDIKTIIQDYQTLIDAARSWIEQCSKSNADYELLLKQVDSEELALVPESFVKQTRLKYIKIKSNSIKQFLSKLSNENDPEISMQFEIAKLIQKQEKGQKVRFSQEQFDLIINDQLLFKINGDKYINLNLNLDTLEELQKLPVITRKEILLQEQQTQIEYVLKLKKVIESLKEGDKIDCTDFTKYNLKSIDSKEAAECQQLYESQLHQFQNISKPNKYEDYIKINSQFNNFKIDFKGQEIKLKQQLWISKIDKFISELNSSFDEEVQSDHLRFWLEEAQELELTKDPKYDILNDLQDTVENIHKAYRSCFQVELVPKLTAEVDRILKRVSFTRIIHETKERILAKKGEQVCCPIELLKKLMSNKREKDSDEHMTGLQQSSDDEMSEVETDTEKTKTIPIKKRLVKAEEKVVKKDNKVLKKPVVIKKSDEKPESSKNGMKGLAGGLKIGGGIKSKLENLKKQKTEVKEQPEQTEQEKPKLIKKIETKIKPKQEPVKAKESVKEPEVKQKAKFEPKQIKKIEIKPIKGKVEVKKEVKKLSKPKEEAETAEITPEQAKPTLNQPKQISGIKRKPMGGLAASLKKLN